MTTIERTREDTRAVPAPPSSRGMRMALLAVVAVLALVLGGVAGWMLRGADDPGDVVLAGDGELTARQEQMIDVIREAEAAWQSNDVDAILGVYAPDATYEAFDTVYRMDDGSFAAYIEGGSWSSLEVYAPVLVRGNTALTFHRFGGQSYSESMTFTSAGDLLVTSHVIHT